MREEALQTPKSVAERGGGAPGTRAEIPQQPVVQTITRQLCPCRPCWSRVEEIHCYSPWKIPLQSRQMPKQNCDPMERSPCWSRFAGRSVEPAGNPCLSSLFLKDSKP